MKSLVTLTVPWIQRTTGILLKNSNDEKPRTIYVKANHDRNPEKILFSIVFPNCEFSYFSRRYSYHFELCKFQLTFLQ